MNWFDLIMKIIQIIGALINLWRLKGTVEAKSYADACLVDVKSECEKAKKGKK